MAGGEVWYLDKKFEEVRHDSSRIYRQDDPWLEPITNFLLLQHGYITMNMIMEDGLKMERSRMNRRDEMRVSEILRELGYEKKRMSVVGKRKYVWAKDELLTMKSKEA